VNGTAVARPSNTDAIAKGTDRAFSEWIAYLDGIGAAKLDHKQIAEHVRETGLASGWWAQSVAVAYEQHIGRRLPGQRKDGTFEVSASRTVPGTLDKAFACWLALMDGKAELDGEPISHGPETSRSDKWRYWRCGLADGGRISMTVSAKGADRTGFGVGHQKLASPDEAARWRAFWKEMLGRI
jgi:hypothetical protein